MPSTIGRRVALMGGTVAATLSVAVGVALGAVPKLTAAPAPASTVHASEAALTAPTPDAVPAEIPTTTTAPAAAAEAPPPVAAAGAPAGTPAAAATPPTTARAATKPAPSPTVTTAAPAATAAAPAAPKLAPGQRLNPTSAQVQAAITQLHQRIPLFAPTEAQLRSFADAVCTSFDQGQTMAQVDATVQKAVTYIQGASLSAPDADFAVRLVLGLRCPGYLP